MKIKREKWNREREWESEVGKLFPVIHRGLELHAKFMNSSDFLIPSMSEWKKERERERERMCECV